MVSSPFIDMLTSPQTVVLSELYNVDVNCEVSDYWLAGPTNVKLAALESWQLNDEDRERQ